MWGGGEDVCGVRVVWGVGCGGGVVLCVVVVSCDEF